MLSMGFLVKLSMYVQSSVVGIDFDKHRFKTHCTLPQAQELGHIVETTTFDNTEHHSSQQER